MKIIVIASKDDKSREWSNPDIVTILARRFEEMKVMRSGTHTLTDLDDSIHEYDILVVLCESELSHILIGAFHALGKPIIIAETISWMKHQLLSTSPMAENIKGLIKDIESYSVWKTQGVEYKWIKK